MLPVISIVNKKGGLNPMITVIKRQYAEGANGQMFLDFEYKGLSTDTKPTETAPVNALFLELDTGDVYFFNGSTWAKVGA